MISELTAQHDSRKSFYGKALVEDDGKGTKTLLSYNTPVAKFDGKKLTLLDKSLLPTALSFTSEHCLAHGYFSRITSFLSLGTED